MTEYSSGSRIENSSVLNIADTEFCNLSAFDGGVILNASSGTMSLSHTRFAQNSAERFGGVIYNFGGMHFSDGAEFVENSAIYGGVIRNDGSASFVSASFIGNEASQKGGVVQNWGTLEFSDTVFSGNSAYDGGAIYNTEEGTVRIQGCTFVGNSAWEGAAIENLGKMTISDTVFSGNLGDGGALFNANPSSTDASVTLENVSFETSSDWLINHGTMTFSGTISVAGKVDTTTVITATGASIVVDLRTYSEGNDTAVITELSKIVGAASYSVRLSDLPMVGTYVLAGGAANFTGSITVLDSEGKSLYELSDGETKDYSYCTLSLKLDKTQGTLSLQVAYPDVADVSVTAEPMEPTQGNVMVRADFSLKSTVRKYSFDNVDWEDYTGVIEVTENGLVYFQGLDSNGRLIEMGKIVVSNIDRVAPEAPQVAASETEETTAPVTVTASFSSDSVVKEYSKDGENWLPYEDGIVFEENGSVSFRGKDAAGNVSQVASYNVTNIVSGEPMIPYDFIFRDNEGGGTIIEWKSGLVQDDTRSLNYVFKYGVDADLTDAVVLELGSAQVVLEQLDVTKTYYCQVKCVTSNLGDSDWSLVQSFHSLGETVSVEAARQSSAAGEALQLCWEEGEGRSYGFALEFLDGEGTHVVSLETETCSVTVMGLSETVESYKAAASGSELWSDKVNIEVASRADGPVLYRSLGLAGDEAYIARTDGCYSAFYSARNELTGEKVNLAGMNRITDMFYGGENNASLLCLTDGNDAFFLDDIYSESADGAGADSARFSNLNRIEAGAGNDLIDLTSTRFDLAAARGLCIHGGTGDDIIWNGNLDGALLFGDAGDDSIGGGASADIIIGGSGDDVLNGNGGDDIFVFGTEAWGTDTITQAESGSVTLWFAYGNDTLWNADTMEYRDGDKVVTVSGVDTVSLKFGDDGSQLFTTLVNAHAFG